MTLDPNVAEQITQLKAAWGTLEATSIKAPGSIVAWCAVDSTSKIKISVPGIIIRLLGTTADGVAEIDKIFKGVSKPGTSPHDPATYRGQDFDGIKISSITYARNVDIILKTPVDMQYKSATRKMKKVKMRFPSIVSLKCIAHWIYNHSNAASRPSSFIHNGVIYPIPNIPVTELGEFSNKVEVDDTTQIIDTKSPTPTQPKNAPKPATP